MTMATTRTGTATGTSSTTNPMGVGDVDSRYRTGADYWTESSGGPGPQVMAADTLPCATTPAKILARSPTS
jgi:hypothetical protein